MKSLSYLFLILLFAFSACESVVEDPEVSAADQELTPEEQQEFDKIMQEDALLEYTPSMKGFGIAYTIELEIVKNIKFIADFNASTDQDEQLAMLAKHGAKEMKQGEVLYAILIVTNPKESSVITANFEITNLGSEKSFKVPDQIIWKEQSRPKNVSFVASRYVPIKIKSKSTKTSKYIVKARLKDTFLNKQMELEKSFLLK